MLPKMKPKNSRKCVEALSTPLERLKANPLSHRVCLGKQNSYRKATYFLAVLGAFYADEQMKASQNASNGSEANSLKIKVLGNARCKN